MNVTSNRTALVTMEDLQRRIAQIVQEDARWSRAAPTTAGSDGINTMDWFAMTESERREHALDALRSPAPMRLIELKKPSGGLRQIGIANRADQAVLYALADLLGPVVERHLSPAAVGFRRWMPMAETIVRSIERDREEHRFFGSVVDIKTCFDTLDHEQLDRAVHALANVGIEPAVLDVVLAHIRVPYLRRDGQLVYPDRGVRQGSVLGPLLANLYLDSTDRRLRRRLAHLLIEHLRYADDIRLPAKTAGATQKALAIVEEELRRVRLSVKAGTGRIYDLRNPRNPSIWLGIAHDVERTYPDPKALRAKAERLQELIEAGRIGEKGLNIRLDNLRSYYKSTTSRGEAAAAVAYIREHLELVLAVPTEESTVRRLHRQLQPRLTRDNRGATDSPSAGRLTSSLSSIPPRQMGRASSSSLSSYPLPSPPCSGDCPSSDPASLRSEVAPLPESLHSGGEDNDAEYTSVGAHNASYGFPLVDPSTPATPRLDDDHSAREPERHRGRWHQQPLVRIERLLSHSWSVDIYTGNQGGEARVVGRSNGGENVDTLVRSPDPRRPTALAIFAVRWAYRHLAASGAAQILFHVSDRNPRNAFELRGFFEDVLLLAVPWAVRLPSGRLVSSGGLIPFIGGYSS